MKRLSNFKEIKKSIDMEFYCIICNNYITPEHGGIVCKCGALYCCDPNCISPIYLKKSISQSQGIDKCPKCED